jgi:hypothetical protein
MPMKKLYLTNLALPTSTSKKALESQWFDTTVDELQAYTALCISQSQVKKETDQSYWRTRKSKETPYFSSVMPLK